MLDLLKKSILASLMAILFVFNGNLLAEPSTQPKDFFLLSIPKSGTHLIVKLLVMLTGRDSNDLMVHYKAMPQMSSTQFAKILEDCKNNNQFAYQHPDPFTYGSKFEYFGLTHPEYVKILQIRDLRDSMVSFIYHVTPYIKAKLGGNPSFDLMLSYVLNYPEVSNHTDDLVMMWKNMIRSTIEWQNKSDTVVIRFEELVGSKGGGSDDKQAQAIVNLASHLGIVISSEQLNQIQQTLFGNDSGPKVSFTFRNGHIGSWKEHFKPRHIKAFKEKWGHYQTALGYSLD